MGQGSWGPTSQSEILLHERPNVELVGQARVDPHDGDAATLARGHDHLHRMQGQSGFVAGAAD